MTKSSDQKIKKIKDDENPIKTELVSSDAL